MAASLFHSATEYVANEITLLRGSVSDIVSVGVYHDTDPLVIPDVIDFTTVTLVDGPTHPLADGDKIDVLSLIGPRNGDVNLAPGTYQRWVLVTTATEDVIRRPDTLTIT